MLDIALYACSLLMPYVTEMRCHHTCKRFRSISCLYSCLRQCPYDLQELRSTPYAGIDVLAG